MYEQDAHYITLKKIFATVAHRSQSEKHVSGYKNSHDFNGLCQGRTS